MTPSTPVPPPDPTAWFGTMDIYLLDQLLRGRVPPGATVLDAGCGRGRNLEYFLRAGYPVYAADRDARAIEAVRNLAAQLQPTLPEDHLRTENVEDLSFPPATADFVICNAVLHFASDDGHFDRMLARLWRVLGPGGLLFTRLASTVGLVGHEPLGGRWYRLPDGSDRFLVDEPFLMERTQRLEATLADPLKTVIVQGQRCMTTWCLRKPSSA